MNDRVRRHTSRHLNKTIDYEAERRVQKAAAEPKPALSYRIAALDKEWDIERWLETNASALAFSGTLLGLLVNKKFLTIPCIVLPFLFQHALQGWCPPIPILRRRGVRTRGEIDAEKYALKALRGDFSTVQENANTAVMGTNAWQAANT